MELNYSKEELAFRDEVRQLLRDELTPEIIAGNKNTTTALGSNDAAMAWQAILNRRGWAGVAWPKEFGGTGWSSNQRYIFNSECEKAGAPKLIPLGLRMLAPVLFKYGTKEQQDYYLPKMLSAEHYWCQGYSEPGSGSDLASLKTRAERDGDFYVVNGTKISLGDHGSKVLPPGPPGATWKIGSAVEVKWGLRFNHGGGYQVDATEAAISCQCSPAEGV